MYQEWIDEKISILKNIKQKSDNWYENELNKRIDSFFRKDD